MPKRLGDYIHLTWQGYLASGIESHKDRNTISPTAAIFEAHTENIRKAARGLAIPNIKQLENEYNTKIVNNLDIINTAVNAMSASEKYDFFKKIALSTKFSQAEADFIAKHMQTDERNGIKYNPPNAATNPFRTGRLTIPRFKTHIENIKGEQVEVGDNKYHYPVTVMQRINDAIEKVKKLDGIDEVIKKETISALNRIIQNLRKYESSVKGQNKIKEQLGLSLQPPIISNQLANRFIDQARSVLVKISAIDSINQQLAQYWAENEGNIIAKKSSALGFWYVNDMISSIAGKSRKPVGSQQSIVSVDTNMVISGDVLQKNLQRLEGLIKKEEGSTKKIIEIDIDGKKIPIHYELFRDYSVQQKADIIYNFDNNGNNQRMDISMKSTDLSKDKYWDKDNSEYKLASIDLQSPTSLLLYLSGIEKMTAGMGTHYLNILAEHSDNEIGNLRYAALESLQISLLYSAMTGELQHRSGGFNANVLAVRDKALAPGVHRVKFFDMSNIIEKVIEKGAANNVVFTPSLANIRLKNEKYPEKDGEDNARAIAARRRAASVVIEARQEVVSVAITKMLLNNIYNNNF